MENEFSSKFDVNNNDLELLDPFVNQVITTQNENKNPFYLSKKGSSFKFVKTNFIAEEHKYIYILCLNDDFTVTTSNINKINLFYDKETDESELKTLANFVSLIRCSFDIIRLNTIRSGLIAIDRKIAEYFNHDSVELSDQILVYLMLQTRESNIRSWMKVHEPSNVFDEFIKKKIFSNYYDINDVKLNQNMLNLLCSMPELDFWNSPENCDVNINHNFKNRRLNITSASKWEITDELINKLLFDFNDTKNTLKNVNYPPSEKINTLVTNTTNNLTTYSTNEISSTSQKSTDIMRSVFVKPDKQKNNKYYETVKPEQLTISLEETRELLNNNILSEQEKYYLVCNMLSSKLYCHYIINDVNIINAVMGIFEKYKPVIRYLMGYAWISLYLEEKVKKTRTLQTDRYVFNLDTASKLPVFYFNPSEPYSNPYFPLTVSSEMLNINKNIGCVKQIPEYQSGIVDLPEFRKRLNLFICGDHSKDLLEGADWSHMAITGGSMAAIIPKTNPLMILFKKGINLEYADINRFYQEYYANSDIDIACNHENILDFIEHVKHIKTTIVKNLGNNIKESDVIIDNIKTLAIYINPQVLKEKCESGEIPYEFDYVNNNKDKREIKFWFYELYMEQKKLSNINNKKILGNKINDNDYFNIIKYCEIEKITIVINEYSFKSEIPDFRTNESNSGIETIFILNDGSKNMPFIKFSEQIKYKIRSKHLNHQFEIFRIPEVEFFSCIARFHLPCVRSYYDGTNCYMLPSAVTAYQTFTNIDFKYFIGAHDPISIMNKYRSRGYGIMLNNEEIKYYLRYATIMDETKKAFKLSNVKCKTDIESILGSLDVSNEFFKPRKNLPENFTDGLVLSKTYTDPKNITYISNDTISACYRQGYPKYNLEFDKYTTILPDGNVNPLKKWVIEAGYDILH
ncbi:hypothetical protein QLL95_gp0881 [Cotonvirus japonicus]|uniref:Uncharacterized protein n=1 Tax=Cotonvirus japonicus TaxID=2811091 RepID=A0ABM7NSV6_9VIRU|nr:hypothetical protein QLL95_gp0881 [Cotonvirus japonicus]BCS83242.1 hypothetical protein [Cotonvirus japonicus]